MIEGVLVTPLRRISNPKGDVLHAIKRSSPGYKAFGEAYFSMVAPGDTKGWKRHQRLTLNLVVPVGTIEFGIVDERESSPTRGQAASVTIGDPDYSRLTVPPGLWVAFRGVASVSSLLLNVADEEHDPAEADNAELGAFPFPSASAK